MAVHSQDTNDGRRFIRRVAKLIAMSLAIVSMTSCMGSSADNSPTSGNTPSRVYAGTFSPTGSMETARSSPTATALPDGRVLIAGGASGQAESSVALASAELYDPATGTFSPTGSLATARNGHTATLLSGGRVLITGGYDGSGYSVSAELYDPATGTFGPTGSMTDARTYHTATLLSDGRVLIAGGGTYDGDRWTMLAAAELYS